MKEKIKEYMYWVIGLVAICVFIVISLEFFSYAYEVGNVMFTLIAAGLVITGALMIFNLFLSFAKKYFF